MRIITEGEEVVAEGLAGEDMAGVLVETKTFMRVALRMLDASQLRSISLRVLFRRHKWTTLRAIVLNLKIHQLHSAPVVVEEEWDVILAKVLMVVVRVLDGVPLKHQASLMLLY